jgi:hypothetical protein
VDKVGNGKAYEMLSCLNGALEYFRTVGDPQILQACLNAWADIVANRLYITGAASYGELFHGDFDLPNVANVGETCVTVTWIQFNAQLLRLTGQARFAEQLEHVVLNQLFGAQQCDGSAWGYYVQMEGKKPYSSSLDGHCCLSSGPRGVALIPTFAMTTDADGVVLNLYDSGTARLQLHDHTDVSLTLDTRYPADDRIQIHVDPATKKAFTVKVRVPAWCREAKLAVNAKTINPRAGADGYVAIHRTWKHGDQIELLFKLEPRLIVGNHKNQGKAAVAYGPLVLAADQALLDNRCPSLSSVALAKPQLASLNLSPERAPTKLMTWPGAQVFRVDAVARRTSESVAAGSSLQVRLIPFADAGENGTQYKVWIPVGQLTANGNLLLDGRESRSRRGNVGGSINDDDPQSFVVTFENKPATEDWFAVTLDEPATISRIVYEHGQSFHDGGWFDAAAAKPRVQVKTSKDGDWETVGELKDYPPTTATDSSGLQNRQRFTCHLASPLKALAIRVIGKPASGDNPQQAFSSCAELEAFAQ